MHISLKESFGIFTREQLIELLCGQTHAVPITLHRASVLQNRVFLFSVLFAVLVPAWSLIDQFSMPAEIRSELITLRLVACAIFVTLAMQARNEPQLNRARLLLACMLAVTPLFHLLTHSWMHGQQLGSASPLAVQLYELLPFIMIAGLTLFPLTLVEFAVFSTPILGVAIYTLYPASEQEIPQAITAMWLLILLLGVSLFASLTQMRYMLSQASRASYDVLTGLLTRRAGIEVLSLQFRLSWMQGSGLTVLYFDLDHFKEVNDTYGHDAGDIVLQQAAQSMASAVRKGDSVVRWGGEEFILVLPMAGPNEANEAVSRIMKAGLGSTPDGKPITASIGMAEISETGIRDWKDMVELADKRMYQAKTKGRARSIGIDDAVMLWPALETP